MFEPSQVTDLIPKGEGGGGDDDYGYSYWSVEGGCKYSTIFVWVMRRHLSGLEKTRTLGNSKSGLPSQGSSLSVLTALPLDTFRSAFGGESDKNSVC